MTVLFETIHKMYTFFFMQHRTTCHKFCLLVNTYLCIIIKMHVNILMAKTIQNRTIFIVKFVNIKATQHSSKILYSANILANKSELQETSRENQYVHSYETSMAMAAYTLCYVFCMWYDITQAYLPSTQQTHCT